MFPVKEAKHYLPGTIQLVLKVSPRAKAHLVKPGSPLVANFAHWELGLSMEREQIRDVGQQIRIISAV